MANQAWIEASLRRSALLGLEVLERASRRRADWTKASLTLQTPTADHEDGRNPPEVRRNHYFERRVRMCPLYTPARSLFEMISPT